MRIVHTMVRVGDLDKSIAFYQDVFGMKVMRRIDRPEGKYTSAFVGYKNETETAVLELTYNYGVHKYDLGTGYGHIAIEVEDVYKACDEIKKRGGKVVREAGPLKHGTRIIAFVEDPDGYKIEITEPR